MRSAPLLNRSGLECDCLTDNRISHVVVIIMDNETEFDFFNFTDSVFLKCGICP